jgi:hypothetical protein
MNGCFDWTSTEQRSSYRVAKRKFVRDVMTETRSTDIATRFYPLAPAGDARNSTSII